MSMNSFKMYLASLKIFVCRNDVKIVVLGTVTGGILQVLAKQYLRNHPEFVTKEKYPRGGVLIEVSGVSVKLLAQVVLNLVAKKGLITGLAATSGAFAISKIPATAVSTYLRDAFSQNLPDLEKKKFILVGKEKMCLDQCDQSLKYLFDILQDEKIPFVERINISESLLTKYLNLKTKVGRRNFVLCISFIISTLANK